MPIVPWPDSLISRWTGFELGLLGPELMPGPLPAGGPGPGFHQLVRSTNVSLIVIVIGRNRIPDSKAPTENSNPNMSMYVFWGTEYRNRKVWRQGGQEI